MPGRLKGRIRIAPDSGEAPRRSPGRSGAGWYPVGTRAGL